MNWLAALWIYTPLEFALAMATVVAGGIVRGYTGFGSGLVMVPLLALLWGPVEALATMTGLGAFATLQLLPRAIPLTNWRDVGPMAAGSLALTPAGTALLVSLDPTTVKKIIAALVLLATLITMRGWVYRGPRGLVPGFVAGGLTGLVNGLAGVGGPATVLYLMAQPGDAGTQRANIVSAMAAVTISVFVAMLIAGVVTSRVVTHVAVFMIPSIFAVWLGAKMFQILPSRHFKLVVLWFLLAISITILVA
jgi:uncharacterized membrane protein YfcA